MSRPTREDLPYRPCAGVVLVNADGHVFVGRRMDHDQGAWQMPQGGIDEDEEPHEAALRELEEETGVSRDLVEVEAEMQDWVYYDLPDELLGRIWKGKYRGQKQKWLLCRFRGHDDDVNIEMPNPEFSAWTWMPASELKEQIVPFKRDVYDRIFREFGDRLS